MTIKHIVLSGGSYKGLYSLGALYQLSKKNFYCIDNIKSIFATSIGTVLGAILQLNMDWDDVLDYIIKRPWHKTFEVPPDMIFEVMDKKGFLNIDIIVSILEKLFSVRDLQLKTITLQEFYDFSKIEFNLFSLHLNHFSVENFSYLTHPDLKLIDAIYMSCSIPFIFQPLFFEGSYMVDGGVLCHFPLQECLDKYKNKDEILGIHIKSDKMQEVISKEANLFTYSYYMFDCLVRRANRSIPLDIPYCVIIPCLGSNTDILHKLINIEKERQKCIEEGKKYADLFLSYKQLQGGMEKLS